MIRHSPSAFSSSWSNIMLWTFRKSSPIPPSKGGPGPLEKLLGKLEAVEGAGRERLFRQDHLQGGDAANEGRAEQGAQENVPCLIFPNCGGPESIDLARQGPSTSIPRCGISLLHWSRSQASQRNPWARSIGPRDLFYLSHRRFSVLGACAEGKWDGVLING